ncbi:hypothetical protein NHQ30_008106 [Ciborinia camelliae]|nr:hypothetical protein NHQ30_008106 [Ciborinia camelliae]
MGIQNSTFLSIMSTIANILISVAFSEAVNIAWWLKALHGTDVSDLHHSWSFGQGIWNALLSGKNFNKIALSALLTSIVVIDGPLLQRASTVRSQVYSSTKALLLPISPGPFVNGGTGLMTSLQEGSENLTGLYTPTLLSVLQDYNSRKDLFIKNSGCGGLCNTTVIAAGFDTYCTTGFVPGDLPYNINATWDSGLTSIPTIQNASSTDPVVFSVNIKQSELQLAKPNGAQILSAHGINITTIYKDSPGIHAGFMSHTCLLYENIGKYTLLMLNDTITSLPLPTQNVTEKLIIRGSEIGGGEGLWGSTIGGIWFALFSRFSCRTTARQSLYGYAYTYNSSLGGPIYSQYVSNNVSIATENMTFTDPMPDILNMARELSFRFVLLSTAKNLTDTHPAYAALDTPGYPKGYNGIIGLNQSVPVSQTSNENVYAIHRAYLFVAVAIILVTCAAIFPVFLGWWKLGRTFSQSPIEIAKAFNAPLLNYANSNSGAKALVNGYGHLNVKYSVVDGEAMDIDLPETGVKCCGGGASVGNTLSVPTRSRSQIMANLEGRIAFSEPVPMSIRQRETSSESGVHEMDMSQLGIDINSLQENHPNNNFEPIVPIEASVSTGTANSTSTSTHRTELPESKNIDPKNIPSSGHGSYLEFTDSFSARSPHEGETFL